jgi:hypothetical protein
MFPADGACLPGLWTPYACRVLPSLKDEPQA